jgi:elongation factor G
LFTGCTIADPKAPIVIDGAVIPSPTIYVAVSPKNKKDEDKISSSLHRLSVEDPSFQFIRKRETAQLLVGGQGMQHINLILEKLGNMFKVEVEIEDQKIVYRETIKKKAEAEGRHKKQSGGSGQFGVVKMRFEPIDPNVSEFEFDEEIHGGSVPKNYFPAVEKGLHETFEKGPLAGFPVIGVRSVLFDGAYHAVDSNEISFKLAARLAFKNALADAKPTLLEPIMKLEIIIKDDYVGDVMGDINKRRGQVSGMDPLDGGKQRIVAEAPESEIISYTLDLQAMTQGTGSYQREFVRYEEVPHSMLDKLVEELNREEE